MNARTATVTEEEARELEAQGYRRATPEELAQLTDRTAMSPAPVGLGWWHDRLVSYDEQRRKHIIREKRRGLAR